MKLAMNNHKKSRHLIVKILNDFVDLALEAIAPRTCKTCMVPLGKIGVSSGVADYCTQLYYGVETSGPILGVQHTH